MRVLLLVLGLLLLTPVVSYSQANKIGVIDLQMVIANSKAGKAAKSAFEAEFKQKQQISGKNAQLEALKTSSFRADPR
jgi:Skp family chaperone for outer membrane proteins